MSSLPTLSGPEFPTSGFNVSCDSPAVIDCRSATLVLRRKKELPEASDSETHLSHEELAERHSADTADVDAVTRFAALHGLEVERVHAPSRTVVVKGSASKLAGIFCSGEPPLGASNGQIPAELKEPVVAVLGFEGGAIARRDSQFRPRTAAPGSYSPAEIAKFYSFPPNNGAGQTIALIELGGGYNDADLTSYWREVGVADVSVESVSIDGGSNSPTGDGNGPDGEVALDIEVAGAVAPGAAVAVYFAPNTDAGFLAAINAAIHDTVRRPSVISISWGSAEDQWSPQTMNAFNAAFHDAALLGISVCVASGDNGSSDGETDGKNHVDFPASSPWVLACGGTRLIGSNGQIQSETVWNDGAQGGASGGGVSAHFSRPWYQSHVSVPKPFGTVNATGRGVPDVAGVADPETGYNVLVDGRQGVVGGTSAVAPLWAALLALCNQQLGKNLGFINSLLYGTIAQHKILHDITSGSNGTYKAGTGWDPCTGWGTPNGTALMYLLEQTRK
jgi:kumamolisin